MKLLQAINAKIESLEAQLAKEEAIIANAKAAKQVGDGYWKKAYALECQLSEERMFRRKLIELMRELAE